MSNFDDLFEAVESFSYDLSRSLDTIRDEIEGLTREYEELLNLLQVSDHKSAVEAILKLKSDPWKSSTTGEIKEALAKGISKAIEAKFPKVETFRDIAGLI